MAETKQRGFPRDDSAQIRNLYRSFLETDEVDGYMYCVDTPEVGGECSNCGEESIVQSGGGGAVSRWHSNNYGVCSSCSTFLIRKENLMAKLTRVIEGLFK